jgi:hypothetical protein
MSLFSIGQQLGQMAANKGLQMAKKPSGGVRRRNETRDQFRGRMDNNNSDIDAIFRGVQQTRTKVHKGLSGMPLNPDGTDPGNSFDRFMRQNPHLGGAAQRQAQYDQQARGNMASAVAERKALQDIQSNMPSSKSVVGADGYRSIFDSSGNAVGTTAPVGNGQSMVFDDALGQMVPMSAWSQRKDYVQGTKGMGPTSMQQAANKSVSKPSGMDQIFGGGAKQPSSSGVAGGGVVEPPQPKGAPGGELFGQMPEFKSSGMAMPQQPPQAALPNDLGSVFAQQSRQKYFNPAQLSGPLQASTDQAQVKQDLNAMGNMQFRMADLYPGSDYTRIEQMFPGFKFDNYATTNQALDALRQLLSMYQ